MGGEGLAASVLDSGALIAIERRTEWARAFLLRRTGPVVIPAAVLAQVWRDGARQARLARFLRARGTVIEPLDGARAKAVGFLLGQSSTTDVIDGSVVVSARRHQALVLTSDPDDIRRIDPNLDIETL